MLSKGIPPGCRFTSASDGIVGEWRMISTLSGVDFGPLDLGGWRWWSDRSHTSRRLQAEWMAGGGSDLGSKWILFFNQIAVSIYLHLIHELQGCNPDAQYSKISDRHVYLMRGAIQSGLLPRSTPALSFFLMDGFVKMNACYRGHVRFLFPRAATFKR